MGCSSLEDLKIQPHSHVPTAASPPLLTSDQDLKQAYLNTALSPSKHTILHEGSLPALSRGVVYSEHGARMPLHVPRHSMYNHTPSTTNSGVPRQRLHLLLTCNLTSVAKQCKPRCGGSTGNHRECGPISTARTNHAALPCLTQGIATT